MQEREKIRQLFERYRQGLCTPEEQAHLHAWLNQYAADEAHGLDELREEYDVERAMKRKRWLRWLPYAATLLMASAITWYFSPDEEKDVAPEQMVGTEDIPPGGNRATLILSDGSTIDLSEVQSGIVVEDKRILYEGDAEELIPLQGEVMPLVISTPKGGTYQVTLSDGTKVWLNAENTLKYHSRFEGVKRVVEVEGDAYF